MEKFELMQCYHCGNKTLMKLLANCKNQGEEELIDEDEVYYWEDEYFIYVCPVCRKATIKLKHSNSEDGPDFYESVLYPYVNIENNYLPRSVKNAFEAALKVKNIDTSISLIALRRTLEMVCIDKGERNGTLYDKLKALSEKGILPPILDDMAKVLRELGNIAAHEEGVNFDQYDLENLYEFTETILNYLYKYPIELELIQHKLAQKLKLTQMEKAKATS